MLFSLFSCGSTCEGTQLKEKKREMRDDVTESLAEINSILNGLGDDSISSLGGSVMSKCNGDASGRAESVIGDFPDIQEEFDKNSPSGFSRPRLNSEDICVNSSPSPDRISTYDKISHSSETNSGKPIVSEIPISQTSVSFQRYPTNTSTLTYVTASVSPSFTEPYRPPVFVPRNPFSASVPQTAHYDGASRWKPEFRELNPTQ